MDKFDVEGVARAFANLAEAFEQFAAAVSEAVEDIERCSDHYRKDT